MTTASVIGTGSMGSVIADLLEGGGAAVQRIGRADGASPVEADVVVLAVPYAALAEIAAQRADELVGKIVVDITNPVDFATFDGLVVDSAGSAAAELAAALPQSRVLKAFNTTFAAHLGTGRVGEQPTTVLIAGDDDEAKARLSEIVTTAGLRALDAGSLRRARELEAVGFLQLTLAAREQISWTGGLAVHG